MIFAFSFFSPPFPFISPIKQLLLEASIGYKGNNNYYYTHDYLEILYNISLCISALVLSFSHLLFSLLFGHLSFCYFLSKFSLLVFILGLFDLYVRILLLLVLLLKDLFTPETFVLVVEFQPFRFSLE